MATIIVSNYDEMAYIECVKEKGHYKDLNVSFDNKDIEHPFVSVNPIYRTNFYSTMEEAIAALNLNWHVISDKDIKDKSLKLILGE